jgi:hypothetical protein
MSTEENVAEESRSPLLWCIIGQQKKKANIKN